MSEKYRIFNQLNNYTVIFRFLAAARSRSGENNAQCCFLTPSRRFATLYERAYKLKFTISRTTSNPLRSVNVLIVKEVNNMRWVNGASLLIMSSRKRVEHISLATINFSVFRRSSPCKVRTWLRQTTPKSTKNLFAVRCEAVLIQ